MTADEPLTETIRNCIRVLEMVAVLHHRGFERLRIEPGMAPSGMYWRCGITHAGNMDPENGILCHENREIEMAMYTSGMEDRLFDWDDAPILSHQQLADRFTQKFQDLCNLGYGADPDYATWYTSMLAIARTGGLPYAYEDYGDFDEGSPNWIPTMGESDGQLPLPPRGKQ